MNNLHLEMIRKAGGLWKGAGQGVGGFEDKYLSIPGVWSPHAALHQYMEGPPAAAAPTDDGAMTDAQFAAQMKSISNMSSAAPAAPVGAGAYSQGITTAPVAAAQTPTGGNVTAV